MNAILNPVSLFNVQKLNSTDSRQKINFPRTPMNSNIMSLVSLRNKQINDVKDTVSFSGSPIEILIWW